MRHQDTFQQFLTESIRAEEAYQDRSAVQTVIDGRRDLGFITIRTSTLPVAEFWTMIESNGLETIPVEGNRYEACIYFRPEALDQALELKAIAEKYGGYLAWDASEADSRRIGELLGYEDEDIDTYINKNYR
jgi:hypothetical protein